MISGQSFVKVLCVLTFLGLHASAREIDGPKVSPRANITAFQQARPFQRWNDGQNDGWCDNVDAWFKYRHPDASLEMCWRYLFCDEEGKLWEYDCPEGELFDERTWTCLPEDEATCFEPDVEEIPDHDDRCPPPGSNDIVFLESLYCELFYICINGEPIQLNCRPGQHWNVDEEFCDDPENAGCEKIQTPPPNQLPDCPMGLVESFPHPNNCNWFVHCNRGNRSIQQCPHMHHFDMETRRCLFHTVARCIKQARFG